MAPLTGEPEPDRTNILSIYENPVYITAFLINRFVSCALYAWGLKSAIQVGHPMFYKPAKWLSDRV